MTVEALLVPRWLKRVLLVPGSRTVRHTNGAKWVSVVDGRVLQGFAYAKFKDLGVAGNAVEVFRMRTLWPAEGSL